ncbi:hypothetical protein ES703_45097 [subsurface metagenome]
MNKDSNSRLNIKNLYKKKDVTGLIKSLKNSDINIRGRASMALINLGEQTLEPLIQVLNVDDRNVRRIAACILGYIREARVVESLIKALKDKDWRVRKNAATSLSKIGDKRAIEALIQAIKDRYWIVQDEETRNLEEIVFKVNKDLKNDIFGKVTLSNHNKVVPMIKAVMYKYWFREIPIDLFLHFKEKKEITDVEEKKSIISLELINAIKYAIGHLGDMSTIELIIKDLKDDEYKDVRNDVIGCLLYYIGEDAVKPLIKLMNDDDIDIRKAAKGALLRSSGEFVEIAGILLEELDWKQFLNKIRENSKVEFKSSLRWDIKKNCFNKGLEKDNLKTVAAFLNTKGGTLFIGVSDDCKTYGIENDIKTLKSKNINGFEQYLIQLIINYLGTILTKFIDIKFEKREEKTICKVIVSPSPEPVYFKGKNGEKFYIRVGNTTRQLGIMKAHKYIERNWGEE